MLLKYEILWATTFQKQGHVPGILHTIYFPDIFKFPSMKKADTGRQANI